MESKDLEKEIADSIRHYLYLAEDAATHHDFTEAFNYLTLARAELRYVLPRIHPKLVSFYGALIDVSSSYCNRRYGQKFHSEKGIGQDRITDWRDAKTYQELEEMRKLMEETKGGRTDG